MRLVSATVFLFFAGCALLDAPCGCGESFERDPWDDSALSIGTSHAVAVHCICRCGGEGERTLEPPSSRCDLYETPCTLPSGERSAYVCD